MSCPVSFLRRQGNWGPEGQKADRTFPEYTIVSSLLPDPSKRFPQASWRRLPSGSLGVRTVGGTKMYVQESRVKGETYQEEAQWDPSGCLPRGWSVAEWRQAGLSLSVFRDSRSLCCFPFFNFIIFLMCMGGLPAWCLCATCVPVA